ncbi:MAG: DUF3043 domain-containing protein [Propionibacteriales bacterium]|nr:DUF3043 domain-containing protein [Propionibacteriales bacterium]
MFGRSENSAPSPSSSVEAESPDKKGRPTPTRKEAEAAAKERARAGTDKKAAAKMLREKRSDQNRRMREGMKNGEEKFLPARDQGPVKRAVRDWIDSRLMFTEFVLPILLLILISGAAPEDSAIRKAGGLMQMVTMLLLLVDVVTVRFRLKRALAKQFPDESLKGTTFYAITRMLQLRFMRLPKPNVKLGGQPR